MSTYNNNVLICGIRALDLAHESGSTYDIEGSDPEQALGVVHAPCLENLCDDGHGAVDGVGDDEDISIGSGVCCSFCKVADDGGIGIKEVVAGHAWLSGDASRDQHDFSAFESCRQAARRWVIAGDFALSIDMADVCGDTCEKLKSVMEHSH